MNPNNYASLEASKRLVDAGIVLETEAVWSRGGGEWHLAQNSDSILLLPKIPAPTMAEVWRELPEHSTIRKYNKEYWVWIADGTGASGVYRKINPTDALIDLLIWVRKEQKGKE